MLETPGGLPRFGAPNEKNRKGTKSSHLGEDHSKDRKSVTKVGKPLGQRALALTRPPESTRILLEGLKI